jgi:hypothetical protein
MEPEVSIPCSEQPANCRYPEPDQSTSIPTNFKIHFNIILQSAPRSLSFYTDKIMCITVFVFLSIYNLRLPEVGRSV